MIITRTPYRVSLFGGGSDYPSWYRVFGGAVLGFAINRYCYISLRELPPFFEHKHRIVYSRIESVTDIADIQHPAVRAVLSEKAITQGLEIHHDGDLPARSGLGSSSAFTVGLLNAVCALRGRLISKLDLAEEAIRIEQEVIREPVGSQDQTWAAYGGFNRIRFQQDGAIVVQPIVISSARKADLMSRLVLYFTGVSREAATIAKDKIANISKKQPDIIALMAMVEEAVSIITGSGSLDPLGDLLHESWMVKRGLAGSVTTDFVDALYDRAIKAGARGGKLLGAGGGGFMLLFVDPDRQASVAEAMKGYVRVSFDVDYVGSTLVVYEPNGLSNR